MRLLGPRIIRLSFVGLVFLILFGAVLSRPLYAQTQPTQGFNVEISPLPILINTKPGTTASADLRVRNAGTQDEQLKAVLKTFTADGADGHVTLHDLSPNDAFSKWVSFSQTTFDAPAGLWQTIKMTVNVPKTAAFGYYYAVQFQLANPPTTKPGTTGIQGAVAIFVLLNAEAPGELRQAEVSSFTADHQSYEFLPVNFKVQIHNSGNVHVAAYGNIFVTRGGKQIASLPINTTQSLTIPHSNRIFTASWDNGFPIYKPVVDASGQPVLNSKGQPKRQLDWNFSQISKLRFGHYTANLVMIYNDGHRDIPITGSLSFWVIPWRLVGGLLIILILAAAGMWSIVRRTSRMVKRQAVKVKARGNNDKQA